MLTQVTDAPHQDVADLQFTVVISFGIQKQSGFNLCFHSQVVVFLLLYMCVCMCVFVCVDGCWCLSACCYIGFSVGLFFSF